MSILALVLSVLAIAMIAGDWVRRLVLGRRRKHAVDPGLLISQIARTSLSPELASAVKLATRVTPVGHFLGGFARVERPVSPGEFAVVPNPDDDADPVFFAGADGVMSADQLRALESISPGSRPSPGTTEEGTGS